jgi:hypothetical protein
MDVAEPGSLSDRPHPAMRGAPIEPLAVAPQQDRSFVALADREVGRASRTRDQRDHGGLVALAHDPQCPVTALEPKVLDIGCACFGDLQAVEAEQHGERCVGSVVVLGGEQEPAEFAASSGDHGGSSVQIAVSVVSSGAWCPPRIVGHPPNSIAELDVTTATNARCRRSEIRTEE